MQRLWFDRVCWAGLRNWLEACAGKAEIAPKVFSCKFATFVFNSVRDVAGLNTYGEIL